MSDTQDEHWMRRALLLAERGRGFVEPNPLVGAVVVQPSGDMIGEGWHERFGSAHAEINALKMCGPAAKGDTLYVTLEPCCHQGKTPPCTEPIIQAGVARVVAALADPFPAVSGGGLARLRAAGLDVTVGPCAEEARRLNAPYFKLLATGLPWIHAKWAMTLDGKIATRTGDSKWISSEPARALVHQLRGRMDGIVAGIGTVLADDPLLTARPPGPRTATRIILDSQGRLPVTSQLAQTARQAPVLVAACAEPARRSELERLGCEVLCLEGDGSRVAVSALLTELGRRRMTNILVEGGSAVLGSFLDAGAIDEVHVFIAPKLAGGVTAPSPMHGSGVARIAETLALEKWEVDKIGPDLYVHGWAATSKEHQTSKLQ